MPSGCPEVKSIKDCSSGPVAVATSLNVVIRERTVVREAGVVESATRTCEVPRRKGATEVNSRGAVPALRTRSPKSHPNEQ